MKNKYNLYHSMPIEKIIENNLSIQSIQRCLAKDFNLKHPSYLALTSTNFLKAYDAWPEEKRNKFIKTIGGVVYFNKIKNFIENLQK